MILYFIGRNFLPCFILWEPKKLLHLQLCLSPHFNCQDHCMHHGLAFEECPFCSRSGELRMQKLKSHLMKSQFLMVLPLKPGVGQYIAMHATHTARDFFLANFYPSSPFTCICSKTSLPIFTCVGRG